MKKSIICLLLLILFCFICAIYTTYALYEDNLRGAASIQAASFNVTINDDIIDGTNQNFTIDSLTYVVSNQSVSNKLAPGTSGYFDMQIDPTSVNVAIKFDITLDLSNIDNSNIELDSLINSTHSTELIRTDEFTYSGVININDVNDNTVNNIRIGFIWNNDDDNNSVDYDTNDEIINIPVSVGLTQYLGEELTLYEEVITNEE